jgi:hypothetical protein
MGLWHGLQKAFSPSQTPPADLGALLQRAQDQLAELQHHHQRAAAEAFGLG